MVRERIVIDPERHSRRCIGLAQHFPDDGLASLELSIHPEEVTPILRKLIQPTNTRARIYARDGTLIVDTAHTLARWTAHAQRADHRQRQRGAGNRRTSGRG